MIDCPALFYNNLPKSRPNLLALINLLTAIKERPLHRKIQIDQPLFAMFKIAAITLFCMFSSVAATAQTATVLGQVKEGEGGSGVQGATVVLKSIKDSSSASTTYTDTAGRFQFDDVRFDSFRVVISSVGFETLSRSVNVVAENVSMGVIVLPRSSKELSGVTVIATPPPATQKGDTVQFNASQFKVNPDASAEDLARKIPGLTVENGQVKANGENVQKVTIDGRELFGDDATAALRNLPAEIIDKIQVFDRLSDQAQLTGFDDGNAQKGINIVTKANMRNGQFGRVFAGYGTDNRYAAGGNTTFLKENRKISLVGNFNNVNQQNFSSQDLLGVTNNGQNSGRGGRGGGGGNRGGGNFGGGNNSNFLVGQQNGINKTNAIGINYADIWGKKLEVTGSYFFNNTNNNTNELSNTNYFSETLLDNTQRTLANSKNNNHRVNLRMEYKIDSFNQLIFTPSVSFQDNNSTRDRNTAQFNSGGSLVKELSNISNNQRSGTNLNSSLLYRRSFQKRGRTFSINLNTSYNNRNGESFVNTLDREYFGTGFEDSASQRFTDQFNDGLRLSTNLNYTEPLGENSQLQISYNPSLSKNNSDQETFGMNPADNKYSVFLDSLSNKFENKTVAQNAGLSYRLGNRDKQLSFGVNYQYTDLASDQTSPQRLPVNKTFSNFLPNAMLRYKLSLKSNLRINYRANVSQPSVTQLQNVLDITDAPFYTTGNPELEQQYNHTLSTRYTFTNTAKGILFMGNVFLQSANNYISNATFDSASSPGIKLRRGEQVTMPVNLDGYASLRSFVTFAVPLKFIKSNFNVNAGFSYNKLPGLINNITNKTQNYTYTLGSVLSSNISEYVDFNVSYSANFNQVKSSLEAVDNQNYFSQSAGLQMNLLTKKGWFLQNDITNQLYSGLTEGFNQAYFLWNAGLGKKFLKDNKGELKLSVFDLLKQNQSITRNVTENYIEDLQNDVLTQYFMLTFTYNLRNFGTAASRASNRMMNQMR